MSQVIRIEGEIEFRQGCTGTIIGDRAVVTAAHCLILNYEEFMTHGAEPDPTPPMYLSYAVGDDAQNPECELQAVELHLHPDVTPGSGNGYIDHDIALIILEESVLETCPEAIPISHNREPISEDLIGETMLQGGFGSLDGSRDFSPIRYWSLLELESIDPPDITLRSSALGTPTLGDSGSGILSASSDNRVRTLGVYSYFFGIWHHFIRLDAESGFLDEMLDDEQLCGGCTEGGLCRDDFLVTCNDQSFAVVDCGAELMECVVDDEDGTARCRCSCDGQEWCEDGCDCDPDCPCECDVTEECDEDCDCDGECHGPAEDDGDEPDDEELEEEDDLVEPNESTGSSGEGCSASAAGRDVLPHLTMLLWG